MSEKVIQLFREIDDGEIILKDLKNKGYSEYIVVGMKPFEEDPDFDCYYFSCKGKMANKDVLWLLEKAKTLLLRGDLD